MSQEEKPTQTNHIARIDVLRAAAILFVFNGHFDAHLHYFSNRTRGHSISTDSTFYGILGETLLNGSLGVDLFFVISGLCIRLSQIGSKNFSIPHFYWRRIWRIYPPYLVALIAFGIYQHNIGLGDILAHVFLVHNFFADYIVSINGPFWSLALEMQVYLLFPCLLALHHRFGAIRTATILFLLSVVPNIIAGSSFRALFHLPAFFANLHHMPTLLWFTWYLGFLLADALVASATPGWLSRIALLGALVLFALCMVFHVLVAFEVPVAGVLLTLLAFEYLTSRTRFPVLQRAAACLGICSYSFYLYFDRLIDPSLAFLAHVTPVSSMGSLYLIGYLPTLLAIFAFSYFAYRAMETPSVAVGRSLYGRLVRKSPRRDPVLA